MNLKRSLIIMLSVLCILLAITAVSATDSSTDVVNATDDDSLGLENDGDILSEGETDDGTFAALNTKISGASEGDTVYLWNDYEYSSSDSGTEGIYILNSLTLDGQGHKIDAKGKSSIFYIYLSGNYDITFKNIVFVNGKSGYGGAIYWAPDGGNGKIINCTFINNTATESGGGAVDEYAGISEIVNCTFINNSATGGGILNLNSTNVINSIFLNNKGTLIGGNNIVANYNWFGNTIDDYETNVPNVDSTVTLSNYYVLDMSLDDNNREAIVSLNNLYENGIISRSYESYALPSIRFDVKAIGTTTDVDSIVLGTDGVKTFTYNPTDAFSITISNSNVKVIREVKPTFLLLNNKIAADGVSEINLEQDYEWDSSKDSSLTDGIVFAKDMTIDGKGHIIDARGSKNIFYFNDVSESYNLTLKNIIFKNAITTANGAAVYFKGNKIEIINCTFINNTAESDGDAIYIANANGNANKISESLFLNNLGENSVVFANLDSTGAKLELTNSIFMKNNATRNVKGTGNVVVEHNWCGNTIENYDDADVSKVDGATLNNWLFLKIDANAVLRGIATLSLNNVYDGSEVTTYGEYSLPTIKLDLGGLNASTQVSSISLGGEGKATYQFRMNKLNATLTANNDGITTVKELKYIPNDDGSFKALNEIIWFSSENDMIELTKDYAYSDSDSITPGIAITKTITIDGKGNTIDAKGKCGIFFINSPNVVFKNITFKNGISENGGAIYCSEYADLLTIENCNFINNSATNTNGGAICSESYNFGSVVNSTFINNTAVKDGAAIFTYSYFTDAIIDNCLFINNSAPLTVLYLWYVFNCHDSIFLNNTGNYIIGGDYCSWGTLGNNWFGNTFDDYQNEPSISMYVYKWLYLDIKFYENYAIVYLNKLFDTSQEKSKATNYNLPKITLKINSTTLNLNTNNVTLQADGTAIVPYELIGGTGALTVSYGGISLTKYRVLPEFDVIQDLIDNALENSVIELDRDYTYNGEDEITGGIIINKNITIDGKGHTIDAKQMTRIFNVQALNVTFKNIVFANGKGNLYYSGGGNPCGAIYFDLDNTEAIEFNIDNCTFVNNTANNYANYPGGAIYIKANGGTYHIKNTLFLNNNAPGDYGGAIYLNVKDAEFNLYNSSFIGNKAKYNGALYIETDNTEIQIDKCLFRENSATSTSYSSNGNAIIWKTTNDSGNSLVKNSVFLDNGNQKNNGQYTFLLSSGTVNIDCNWWGTTANNHPETFGSFFVSEGLTPNTWLFINSTVSSDSLLYNETATIKYFLQLHDGVDVSDFDNSKLPDFTLDVTCDKGELDKDTVSLNEEFTFRATGAGTPEVDIYCNSNEYPIYFKNIYMVPICDVPFIIYANQGLSKNNFIKTANGYDSKVTITCNDSSLISLGNNYDVTGKTIEGTAKLTFSYNGYYTNYPNAESLDIVVKVVKVPLTINVTNIEGNEITLNVTDTLNLDIAFEIDETHKGYAPAWSTMGVKYDSSIISFDYEDGVNPDNGSYYPTGHILAKAGGTTNLTIYSTSDKFAFENYTIKIIVNKIPTDIAINGETSFKVDDVSKVNADFYVNDTLNTLAQLIYESSDINVVEFTSNAGDFKAVGNGTAVLTVKFAGNSTHEASSKTFTVTVTKYDTSTTVTSDKELSLRIDDKSQVTASLTSPDTSFTGSLIYISSNESVATVDSNGLITAVGAGSATITAKYEGNYRYANSSDSLTVKVGKLQSNFTIETPTITIDVYENALIQARSNNDGDISFSSCDTSIVKVDGNNVTALKGGKVNVTLRVAETERYLANETNVTIIVNKLQSTINVANTVSVDVGETKSLGASVDENRQLRYLSTNSDIVTVSADGRITGIIGGTANVTVMFDEDDQYLASEVNVTVTVNKLQTAIDVEPIFVDVYQNKSLDAQITGDGAVTYASLNPGIVTVNQTGYVTGVIGGKANVTITVAESDRYLAKTVNVTVTVNKLQTAVDVEPIFVDVYQNKSLDAQIIGDGAVTYISLNPGIVTVNQTGYVTGVIGGKANVTITVAESDRYLAKTVNVTVTVNKLPSIFTNAPMSLRVDENATINSTLNHDGAVHYEFDPAVLNVTEDGLVIAKAGGVHTIIIIFDGNERYLENTSAITVTVSRLPVDYENEPINLTVFETSNIEFLITGYNHTNSEYSSSNESVFTVDSYGLIAAVSGGSAILNIKFADTDRYLGDSINITVNVSKLPSIFRGDDHVSVMVDETRALPMGVEHNRQLIYESSNPNIVTVDGNGFIRGIAGGNAVITVRYDEDGQYLANTTEVSVLVNKLPSSINVETQPVTMYVGDEVSISATTDNDGGLFFTTNSPIISLSGDGRVVGVSEGTTDVIISVFETETHLSNRTTLRITVKKIPTEINVEGLEMTLDVNDAELINASLNHPEAGSLTYTSSNPEVVSVNDEGRITALSGGEANITISYAGNDQYVAAQDVVVNVVVNKLPTVIEVNATFSLKVDDRVLIGASINHNGTQLKYSSSNSSVIVIDEITGEMTAIAVGKANITVSCEGTDQYLKPEDVIVNVEVTKIETAIILESENQVELDVFGESNIIAGLNHSQAGSLTYTSSDENIVLVDDQGLITAIAGGNANITISYGGNDKYEASQNVTINVVVNKLPSSIIVDDAISVDVDSFKSLNAYMENGRPLSYISNNEFIATVDEYGIVTGIAGGKTNVTVFFVGDEQYGSCEVNVTVTVNKLASTIDVESTSIVVEVGNDVEIIATTDSDGELRYSSLNSSIATVNGITVTGVTGGCVNVTVSVAESDRYLASEVNVTVTVNKLQSAINVENVTLTVDVGQSVKIMATTNSDMELTYSSFNSSIASVSGDVVTGVAGGCVNVTVSVAESERYLASAVNVTVFVNKLISTIYVENASLVVDVDGNVLIIASTDSDAALVYESLDESIATVNGNVVTGVSGGCVNVTVSVAESERYLASEVNVTITVNKVQPVIAAKDITINVDEARFINATLNVDGTLRYINNNPQIIAIDESGVVTGIIGGTANVTVIFDETGKYLACELNVTVTVNKLQSGISIENSSLSVDVGGNVLINASTDSDADLAYESLDESVATVNLNNVTAIRGGIAIVTVSVAETDRFLASSANVTVTVNKLKSIIDVENDEIFLTIDGKQQIVASTNSDSELSFLVSSSIISIDGMGLVTGISNGTAQVKVIVDETDRYLANSSIVTVRVNKIPTAIAANESVSLTVGDQNRINATLNHDGELNYMSLDEDIVSVDSQGNIKAVKVGKTQIIVRFMENDRYLGDSISVNVTVDKIEADLNTTFSMDLRDGSKTPTFSINLTNATGNFTVIVDGKTIDTVSLKDGKASITVPELEYGSHNVTVIYSGDDKYDAISQNATVDILKPVLSENKDIVMIYTSNVYYKVRVTVDGRPIVGENVVFEFNGVKYNARTDKNGYAKFRLSSAKPMKSKYAISATFNDVTVRNTVKVNSIIKAKNIKAKKSSNAVKINVNLKKVNGKYLAGKKIKLKLNGKKLTAKTNKKGKATFKVKSKILKKLKVGKKYPYTVTYGMDKVTKKIKIKK